MQTACRRCGAGRPLTFVAALRLYLAVAMVLVIIKIVQLAVGH
jgi:hypothetical protein